MRIAITSSMGEPSDPKTWSSAPANLSRALQAQGAEMVFVNSAVVSKFDKMAIAATSILNRHSLGHFSRFPAARAKMARHVTERARAAQAEHILCCTSLDAPVTTDIPYSLWIDDSWHLHHEGRLSPGFSPSTVAMLDDLDRTAFQGAHKVLTFSHYLRNDIISHYGIAPDRVVAVGCGSGELSPFHEEKSYQDGHLLFVAKHQFDIKGGALLLNAWPLIREERPQTRLIIVGNEDGLSRAKNITGITGHGFVSREELTRLFYGAAMLVQPMLGDPWGQVYLEAMKAKAIVVSLNQAALPELSDNGRLAVLIDQPDPQLLADAVLATYHRNQNELNQIAVEAQKLATESFSWSAVADRVLEAISQ
ncbi:glycosyltransferase family 4 protein [Parasphingorhabdus sp.]|uniref:glycosyltransferase family 4 protein n=1 Tax=Parasphingorhabdus sp. TaxID=2709688 RepID=UPI00300102C4